MELGPSIVVSILLSVGSVSAQTDPSADSPIRLDGQRAADGVRGFRWNLPLFDLPYNVESGLRGPSMQQSLAVTEAFYEVSHAAIEDVFGSWRWLARGSIAVWDFLTIAAPFADAWIHEEFHRAVLGQRDIDSFNDVYRFDLWADEIAVSRVADEDLVRLKRDHPADQVRLGAAGLEGEYLLVQQLERNRFFGGWSSWHLPLYWLLKLSSTGYVMSGTWDETNEDTDRMNLEDGADVRVRDFTGHDFTAWVYDLHRPSEPYGARGVHPSGVGIDRYIKPADLTPEEFDYLERQGRLQVLNFIDPNLFGVHGFAVRDPFGGGRFRLNATLGHLLTSFGHTVDLNLFLRHDRLEMLMILHRYENGSRSFTGVDARMLELPVTVGDRDLELSSRIGVWSQPRGQDFRTEEGKLGGLAALRAHGSVGGRFGIWGEVEAKTAGWVAGIVPLERSVALRVGGSVRFGAGD